MVHALFWGATALNLLWTVFAFRGGPLPGLGLESPGGVAAGLLWFVVVYPLSTLGLAALATAGTRALARDEPDEPAQHVAGQPLSMDPEVELVEAGDDDPVAWAQAILLESGRTVVPTLRGSDPLTGLLDRGAMVQAVADRDRPFTVALVEIERIRQYVERHGHLAGSRLVLDVSRLLRRGCPGELLARWDDGAFVVTLTGDLEDATRRLREVLVRVQATIRDEGPGATLSAAVAHVRAGESIDLVLAAADSALASAEPRVISIT